MPRFSRRALPYRGHDDHQESPGAGPPRRPHERTCAGCGRSCLGRITPNLKGKMGHGTDLMNCNRHEAPLLQVCLEVTSSRPLQSCKLFFRIVITRIWVDPKHDIDLVTRDFHALDQRPDKVAFAHSPPSLGRRGVFGGKVLQPANN